MIALYYQDPPTWMEYTRIVIRTGKGNTGSETVGKEVAYSICSGAIYCLLRESLSACTNRPF